MNLSIPPSQIPYEVVAEMVVLALQNTHKYDGEAARFHAVGYLEANAYPHLLDVRKERLIQEAHTDNGLTVGPKTEPNLILASIRQGKPYAPWFN